MLESWAKKKVQIFVISHSHSIHSIRSACSVRLVFFTRAFLQLHDVTTGNLHWFFFLVFHRNPMYFLSGLYNGLSSSLMNKIFKLKAKNPCNLRQVSEFSWPMVKSGCYGTESILYLGPKIWDILPESLKNTENLEHFKKVIKTWKPENCPCRYKVYIESVGFL